MNDPAGGADFAPQRTALSNDLSGNSNYYPWALRSDFVTGPYPGDLSVFASYHLNHLSRPDASIVCRRAGGTVSVYPDLPDWMDGLICCAVLCWLILFFLNALPDG